MTSPTSTRIGHGAPGVFIGPSVSARRVTGVRRDLAAFAGVAPRGPARMPIRPIAEDETVLDYLTGVPTKRSVAVEIGSWSEYRRRFGGFGGAGRLPYAVSAFFAQGGRRARVIRIVHDYAGPDDAGGCAQGVLAVPTPGGLVRVQAGPGDDVVVAARDEGTWGNRLRATLSFSARPLRAGNLAAHRFEVDSRANVPIGSLIRATDATGQQALRYVADSRVEAWPDRPGGRRIVTLGIALVSIPVAVEVVAARLTTVDDDNAQPRVETLGDLGCSPEHPRWLARVLIDASELLWPRGAWVASALQLTDSTLPDLMLASAEPGDGPPVDRHLGGGTDRSNAIVGADFFDADWVLGDERPADGLHATIDTEDVGLLLAPDLYDPAAPDPVDDIADPPLTSGPDFAPCVDVPAGRQGGPAAGLDGLRLDPNVPGDLVMITELQQRLVAVAEAGDGRTALLDVPPGLSADRVTRWRASFDSADAAAYHPWLDVAAPDDARDSLVRVNPSAFAAGVIAARELRDGVFVGPANLVVNQAVRLAASPTRAEHDDLHADGVNVFVQDRDGIRLTGARTLSRIPDVRQLNVARLLAVIRITLRREMAWAAFEPNGPALWTTVRRAIADYLTTLHRAGALAGATPGESFFVRCDRTTMTQLDLDNGRLVALVGVAPAEPTEFIVVRLTVDDELTARVEMSRG